MRIQCTCRQCGVSFTVEPNVARNGGGIYCSRDCLYTARRKRPASATCERCGVVFKPQPKTAGRFCSTICSGRDTPRVERICEVCGAGFSVKPSVVERGHGRYCSQLCSAPLARSYTEEQFWAALWAKTRPEGDCLIWTGRVLPSHSAEHEYPIVHVPNPKRKRKVSQVVLEQKLGRPILPGYQANHTCDRVRCVAPAHLYEGTQQENMDDMYARGRGRKSHGSKHWNSKLTEDQVREIKLRLRRGVQQKTLAVEYGVSFQLISEISRGNIWGHVIVLTRYG